MLLPARIPPWQSEKLLVQPKPLRYGDISRAVDKAIRANWDDLTAHYLEDTPDADRNPVDRALVMKVSLSTMFVDDVHRGEAWTIEHGDSVLRFSPAPVTVQWRRRALNSLINIIIENSLKVFELFSSNEQKKRKAELREKLRATTKGVLSDRVAELICLAGLSTAPEKQGRGYASLLVNQLVAMMGA